ncbi:MAG: hypothetical protein HKN70_05450 [Gammaproteobacteria bacterium]|nr:hypothetical protein [Gammaproteobacteria bacterium]
MSVSFRPGYRCVGFVLGVCLLTTGLMTDVQADSSLGRDTASTAMAQRRDLAQLNISLAVFQPGIPADAATHRAQGVFPKIRRVEARFLPYVIRDTLTRTNVWGAVRVIPTDMSAAELLVTGKILHSDGQMLKLHLRAADALGRVWIDADYAAEAEVLDGPPDTGRQLDPFQGLFDQFADDLQRASAQFDRKSLTTIKEVAVLKYAGNLLPDAFGDYLAISAEGMVEIRRLPATNDPMLDRIQRIRHYEYVFIDTLDEQYESLYSNIAPTYNLWRRYQSQLARYKKSEEQRRRSSKSGDARGSYAALKKSYENYKWIKMEEQNLETWATGFNNEIAPTVVDMEGRVIRLEGSLEERYTVWRELLSSMFSLETGMTDEQPGR